MIEISNIISEYKEATNFLTEVANFYHTSLYDSKEAYSYVRSRKWDKDIIDDRKIGYSSNSNNLIEKIKSLGFDENFLIRFGIFLMKDEYSIDLFDKRIIFPIKDLEGNTIGFSGRILDDTSKQSKYVNSISTSWFSKSLSLYNIDLAIKTQEDFIILVEGIPDVITFIQNEVYNVVAPCGTALTEEQVLILKYLNKKVIILMDGDGAGRKSTLRIEDMFKTANLPYLSLSLVNPEDKNKKIDPDEYIHTYGVSSILNAIKN